MSTETTSIVQEGDTVVFPSGQLEDPSLIKSISWQQGWNARNESFINVLGHLTGSNIPVFLFVQSSLKDKFQEKLRQQDEKNSCFVVDDSFQYGQNKDQTFRFLVFQDKSNKEYQHRFLTLLDQVDWKVKLSQYAKVGADLLSNVSAQATYVSSASQQLQAVFGDYLHDFDNQKM